MRRCVGYIHIEGFYAGQENRDGRTGPFAVVDGETVKDAGPPARRSGVRPGHHAAIS